MSRLDMKHGFLKSIQTVLKAEATKNNLQTYGATQAASGGTCESQVYANTHSNKTIDFHPVERPGLLSVMH